MPEWGETTPLCWLNAQHESPVSGWPEIPPSGVFYDHFNAIDILLIGIYDWLRKIATPLLMISIQSNTMKKYRAYRLAEFDTWLTNQTPADKAIVLARIATMEQGSFGDFKALGGGLYEARFFLGAAFRLYYVLAGDKLILMALGGTKDTQDSDIKKARAVLDRLVARQKQIVAKSNKAPGDK